MLFAGSTSHKTFRRVSELATEKGKATSKGSGFAGPKVLIFIQRKRNLVETAPSPSPVSKVTSPSKTTSSILLYLFFLRLQAEVKENVF